MQLQHLFEKVSQLVTVTFEHHPTLTYTMVLRPVGTDGAGRPVYVGNCEVHDTKDGHQDAMFVAAVFRTDGTLYAANYWTKMAEAVIAAGKAIATARKAYGKGHKDKHENFDTYRVGETHAEGYDRGRDA
jgi:hypothetical protein